MVYDSQEGDHHNRGTPKDKNIRVAGKYDAYLAEPASDESHKHAAILFLSDIMGRESYSDLPNIMGRILLH